MEVLITGGAGFIGSHLCDALIKKNFRVIVLDNFSTGSHENIVHLDGKIELFDGDIRDKIIVEALVQKCDLILHMAAFVGVFNILENPVESISTNFYGSEIVLNAAAKFEKRILIASTSEIYGKNSVTKLKETDDRVIGSPQKLRWTYSDAKALEEAYAYSLFLSKGLKVTTVRLFNTVGPRQSGKYGMVIPRFVSSALLGNPLEVYGDGQQTRVFCHIEDVINALVMICTSDVTIGEVYNLGGTESISILNLAKLILNRVESKSEIIFKNYDRAYPLGFEEIENRSPDISKIQADLNWLPEKRLKDIIDDIRNFQINKI
jgi:UDP-glucose 4-epimerase